MTSLNLDNSWQEQKLGKQAILLSFTWFYFKAASLQLMEQPALKKGCSTRVMGESVRTYSPTDSVYFWEPNCPATVQNLNRII